MSEADDKILIKISWEHDEENINIKFMKERRDIKLIVHWGIFKEFPIQEWYHPKNINLPKGTMEYDSHALQTEFNKDKDNEIIKFTLNKKEGIGLTFVFYEPINKIWYNNNSKDFQIFFNSQEKIRNSMNILLYKKENKGLSFIFDDPNYENDNKINKKEKETLVPRNIFSVLKYNKAIIQLILDSINFGINMKNLIEKEKKLNPKQFIDVNTALNLERTDKELFSLGLLGDHLQKYGAKVEIAKEKNEIKEEKKNTINFFFNTIINETIYQKKIYNWCFDFGDTINEEYLNDNNKFEILKEKIKRKISKEYNILKDDIIIASPQKGSLLVPVISQQDIFNDLILEDLKSKLKDDDDKEFEESKNVKDIIIGNIISFCKLGKDLLDSKGNRFDNVWGFDEKRGNIPYNPPYEWIGIGLNVLDKYDNGDNTWIGKKNIKGEWAVAYHGVGRCQESNQGEDMTKKIIEGKFKFGITNLHEDCEDKYHPGQKVGVGVYCTPNIKIAEYYSGVSEKNGQKYKSVLMVRVRPDTIRCCKEHDNAKDIWIVNGTYDEIRAYRILYKLLKN